MVARGHLTLFIPGGRRRKRYMSMHSRQSSKGRFVGISIYPLKEGIERQLRFIVAFLFCLIDRNCSRAIQIRSEHVMIAGNRIRIVGDPAYQITEHELLFFFSTWLRSFLAEQYGFECQCSVCSLPEAESRASDKKLEGISDGYERFSGWGEGRINGAEAIAHARKIWKLGEEEGYWSERGRLAADAAWVAAAHSE